MLYTRTSFSLILSLLTSLASVGQISQYQWPASFGDVHTVYEYKKSNWDGTHASTIFLYVADSNKLESFKWAKGDKVATLVSAEIDWNIFSVKQFTNHRLRSAQAPELVAVLKMDGEKKIQIEVGEWRDSLILTELPWQSYDFDFAGLGFTWRALKDKKAPFYFHIADAGMVNGNVAFVNKGRVNVQFIGTEMINNKECLKYTVNGAGLENKGGHIWINETTFMIEQYKIELPDEPGFVNGMLQLTNSYKMTTAEWEKFKMDRVGE